MFVFVVLFIYMVGQQEFQFYRRLGLEGGLDVIEFNFYFIERLRFYLLIMLIKILVDTEYLLGVWQDFVYVVYFNLLQFYRDRYVVGIIIVFR